eukprot:1017415-Rhodomonas_salina.1
MHSEGRGGRGGEGALLLWAHPSAAAIPADSAHSAVIEEQCQNPAEPAFSFLLRDFLRNLLILGKTNSPKRAVNCGAAHWQLAQLGLAEADSALIIAQRFCNRWPGPVVLSIRVRLSGWLIPSLARPQCHHQVQCVTVLRPFKLRWSRPGANRGRE